MLPVIVPAALAVVVGSILGWKWKDTFFEDIESTIRGAFQDEPTFPNVYPPLAPSITSGLSNEELAELLSHSEWVPEYTSVQAVKEWQDWKDKVQEEAGEPLLNDNTLLWVALGLGGLILFTSSSNRR